LQSFVLPDFNIHNILLVVTVYSRLVANVVAPSVRIFLGFKVVQTHSEITQNSVAEILEFSFQVHNEKMKRLGSNIF